MKTEKAEEPNPNKCFVCEHPDGGSAHFGSTSCLACAAFFRRTVSLNIQFVCKKDNDCTIYYELRMICRACRFNKCLTAGMKKECVQKRRSNKKVPKKHLAACSSIVKTEIEDAKYECAADQTDDNSPLSIEKRSPANMIQDSPLMSDSCKDDLRNVPSTSSIASSPCTAKIPNVEVDEEGRAVTPTSIVFEEFNMNGPELLRYYVDQLRHSMDRRRMLFTEAPMLGLLEERGDVPFSSVNAAPHSMLRQFESQKLDNLLAFDFCKSCPGFDLLSQAERAMLYRSCSLAYCLLDIAYITAQAIREPSDNPVMMFTDGSVCTIRDMSYGWDDEETICAIEKKKLFFNFLARLHEAITQPFRKLNITQVEYAFLKALCIWKLGYCEFSTKMKFIGKRHETALLIALHNYYEDFPDPSEANVRLGNIILLMGTVFEMNQLILETFKSAELFELFKMDTLTNLLLSI